MMAIPLSRPFKLPPWQILIVPAACYILLRPGHVEALLGYPVMLAITALAIVAARWTDGRYRSWVYYSAGFALAVKLRGIAHVAGMPIQFEYPIFFDSWLPGPMPTQWLQAREWPRLLNVIVLDVYGSYFLTPWLFAIIVSWRGPERFRRFAVAWCLMYAIGIPLFFLVPTAPPWLANRHGDLPDVVRLIDVWIGRTSIYEFGQEVAGNNRVSAMPSFHLATIVLMYFATKAGPWKVVMAMYVVAMGFTLVYLGEHYVIDELVGALVAWAAWRISDGPVARAGRHRARLGLAYLPNVRR